MLWWESGAAKSFTPWQPGTRKSASMATPLIFSVGNPSVLLLLLAFSTLVHVSGVLTDVGRRMWALLIS